MQQMNLGNENLSGKITDLGDSKHPAEEKSRENIVMISIVSEPNFDLINIK